MTTKHLSALEVWALAMDFGPSATDAPADAPQEAAAPAVTALDRREPSHSAPAREQPVIGVGTLDAEQPS